jgi:hypothetical protein
VCFQFEFEAHAEDAASGIKGCAFDFWPEISIFGWGRFLLRVGPPYPGSTVRCPLGPAIQSSATLSAEAPWPEGLPFHPTLHFTRFDCDTCTCTIKFPSNGVT